MWSLIGGLNIPYSMKALVFFLTLSFFSCKPEVKKLKLSSITMEETIMRNSEVEYIEGEGVKREDLVLVRLTNKNSSEGKIAAFRVIAVSGDNVSIEKNMVSINGVIRQRTPLEKSVYYIRFHRDGIDKERLEKGNDTSVVIDLTHEEYLMLKQDRRVDSIAEIFQGRGVFEVKDDKAFFFDGGRYSYLDAIRIPKEGEVLEANYPMPIVGQSNLKGTKVHTEYYFLMNDDFGSYPDSRGFGLYPKDSIIGVITKIYPDKARIVESSRINIDEKDIQ